MPQVWDHHLRQPGLVELPDLLFVSVSSVSSVSSVLGLLWVVTDCFLWCLGSEVEARAPLTQYGNLLVTNSEAEMGPSCE